MSKIYTKTGDGGETAMLGGKRVKKSCLEIEAIGEVDETNAFLGLLIARLPVNEEFIKEKEKLFEVQNKLLVIGSNLATLQTETMAVPQLKAEDVQKLEDWIDGMDGDLLELNQFILPGGSEDSAMAYSARAVCRRAERCVIKLSEKYKVPTEIKEYLNRLSDCLFTLARWLNKKQEVEEIKWKK